MVSIRGLSPLLQVFDMPRAVSFYRDMLGFELVATSPKAEDGHFDWCMLEQGGAVVMLNTAFEREQRPATSPARNGEGGMSLYFGCLNVDAAFASLRASGWPVDPPRNASYGMRQLYFHDPDGFELCLQHPVERP
jgi:uncharacterized glyoxalase superfamily protein PhnB